MEGGKKMKTNHTQGEWQWGRAGGNCLIFADKFCKKQIAQLTQIEQDNKCEEMDANARLIAVAPKLLELIKDFIFLENTNMTKKQVKLRIEIAKELLNRLNN